MVELLEEAEKVLYRISCCMPLAYMADFDKYPAEVLEILQMVEEIAEQTRERITGELIRIRIAEKKEAEV